MLQRSSFVCQLRLAVKKTRIIQRKKQLWVFSFFFFYGLRFTSVSLQCKRVLQRHSLYNQAPYANTPCVISDDWRCVTRSGSWSGVSRSPSLPPQRAMVLPAWQGRQAAVSAAKAGAPFNPLVGLGNGQWLPQLQAELPPNPTDVRPMVDFYELGL